MEKRRPELLVPAGDLQRLYVAVLYGADAVYIGGEHFGLRSRAINFTRKELIEGIEFAHNRGVKLFVTLNGLLHDADFGGLDDYVQFLEKIGVDAVIVADLGVLSEVQRNSNLVIHLSTQASCLNLHSALFWKERGVKRLTLGREVSLQDALEIKDKAQIEVEIFIHGSMCMFYSGHCKISNYTFARDSNRGGCAHNCRFLWSIYQFSNRPNLKIDTYFLNSMDLCGIDYINKLHGIDSLKVEGRMKSELYLATTTKVYKEALDGIKIDKDELLKIPNRSYFSGSLEKKIKENFIFTDKSGKRKNNFTVIGLVLEVIKDQFILIEVRNSFFENDILELLPFSGETICIQAFPLLSILNEPVYKTRPNTLVKLPYHQGVSPYNIIRGRII